MFKLTVTTKKWFVFNSTSEYRVKFSHKEVDGRKVTSCFITLNHKPLAQSEVKWHPYDVDNVHVANKNAFTKAVNKLPDKQLRTMLWKEYWKHTTTKKLRSS